MAHRPATKPPAGYRSRWGLYVGGQWQADGKLRTFSLALAGRFYRTAVQFDQLARQRQSDPKPLCGKAPALNLKERLKNTFKHIFVDAYAVIRNSYDRHVTLLFGTEFYRAVLIGIFCSVVKQIYYNLFEPYRVRLQIQIMLRFPDRERMAAAPYKCLSHTYRPVYNRVQRERLFAHSQFIVRDARDIEQVVQHDRH